MSKDINGLYNYIARVASTCKQLYEEIDTERRSHKEEIDSLKTHMQAIESRLLVLSPKNKDHKTTTTTGCKCRDKVPPQPQTERKDKAPKKNDKETNNDNELHVVADPQMPVCLTEFPPLSPASEERPINCRNAVGQDDTEAPNTTNAPAAVPTSTDNNGQDKGT